VTHRYHSNMVVAILAREHSDRYPRKHLHNVGGKPLIETMVKRILDIGAWPILVTGPLNLNKKLVAATIGAGGDFYCEEQCPEWDIVTRFVNMSEALGVEYWIEQSGDCPFVDFSTAQKLWDHISTGLWDSVGVENPNAKAFAERALGAKHVSWYVKADECLDIDDRHREQAGSYCPKEIWKHKSVGRSRPVTQTPTKTSIDWPLEGALADLIVRYLGRWPESDDDIEKVYREVKKLRWEDENAVVDSDETNVTGGDL